MYVLDGEKNELFRNQKKLKFQPLSNKMSLCMQQIQCEQHYLCLIF